MKEIPYEKHVYEFSESMEPVVEVDSGEIIMFETMDALGNQIESEDTLITSLDFSRVNPATGPVFVKGAEPGDILKVKILDVELPEKGVIITGKDMGVLGDELESYKVKILKIKNGDVIFDSIRIPISPMIGVIGVAPEKGSFSTGTAHKHGGNMDTKEIGEGAIIYLPVFQEGALLAIGDVHAVMGDGEVCVSACEIRSKVLVRVEVIKSKKLEWPVVETRDGYCIVVSLPNVEEALKVATREAVLLLKEKLNLSFEEAYMLASLSVDIRISQLVDPNKTAKAFIPRSILNTIV